MKKKRLKIIEQEVIDNDVDVENDEQFDYKWYYKLQTTNYTLEITNYKLYND